MFQDFLPSNKSAVLVDNYSRIINIVTLLKQLHENEDEYDTYLDFKTKGVNNNYLRSIMRARSWGADNDHTKPNFVDAFECVVCRRIHENIQQKKQGKPGVKHFAKDSHYGCPKPRRFSDIPPGNLARVEDDWWSSEWLAAKFESIIFKEYLSKGTNFTRKQIEEETERRLLDHFNRNT